MNDDFYDKHLYWTYWIGYRPNELSDIENTTTILIRSPMTEELIVENRSTSLFSNENYEKLSYLLFILIKIIYDHTSRWRATTCNQKRLRTKESRVEERT